MAKGGEGVVQTYVVCTVGRNKVLAPFFLPFFLCIYLSRNLGCVWSVEADRPKHHSKQNLSRLWPMVSHMHPRTTRDTHYLLHRICSKTIDSVIIMMMVMMINNQPHDSGGKRVERVRTLEIHHHFATFSELPIVIPNLQFLGL